MDLRLVEPILPIGPPDLFEGFVDGPDDVEYCTIGSLIDVPPHGNLIDFPLLVNICLILLILLILAVHLDLFPCRPSSSDYYLCLFLLFSLQHLLSAHFEERLVVLPTDVAVVALQLQPHLYYTQKVKQNIIGLKTP